MQNSAGTALKLGRKCQRTSSHLREQPVVFIDEDDRLLAFDSINFFDEHPGLHRAACGEIARVYVCVCVCVCVCEIRNFTPVSSKRTKLAPLTPPPTEQQQRAVHRRRKLSGNARMFGNSRMFPAHVSPWSGLGSPHQVIPEKL